MERIEIRFKVDYNEGIVGTWKAGDVATFWKPKADALVALGVAEYVTNEETAPVENVTSAEETANAQIVPESES